MLARTARIHAQKRDDRRKLYSLDAPEVECISKGKIHKRYEFGCKVSLPYDGHTLSATIERSQSNTNVQAAEVYVDRGYRGHDHTGKAKIYKQDGRLKALTRAIRNKLRRRSAIEPTIGHVKSDNGMARNFLKTAEGDRLNAILAAAGYNMRKLLAAFLHALWELAGFLQNQLREIGKNLCRPGINLATFMAN
ncbi:MAG: hypothetical protein A2Y12_10275 [Planctomycetes bacterium GWF2_42_9]|nr:MAG: hypothetical protein A2Y12_10275 [Planctomycetes bacterium GWF2_42_9]